MKLILYKNFTVTNILENTNGLKQEKEGLVWEDGSISGFGEGVSHAAIPDEVAVEVGNILSNEFLSAHSLKIELSDFDKVKQQQELMQQALDDLILGGM